MTTTNESARLALADFLSDLANQIRNGCSDSNCRIRPRGMGGQHTNGGCRCRRTRIADDLLLAAVRASEVLP